MPDSRCPLEERQHFCRRADDVGIHVKMCPLLAEHGSRASIQPDVDAPWPFVATKSVAHGLNLRPRVTTEARRALLEVYCSRLRVWKCVNGARGQKKPVVTRTTLDSTVGGFFSTLVVQQGVRLLDQCPRADKLLG